MRWYRITVRRPRWDWPHLLGGALLSALLGCGGDDAQGLRGNEKLPEGLPLFDASVDDGGALDAGVACPPHGTHVFNNHFSPYFGGEESVEVEVVHYSSFYSFQSAKFATAIVDLWTRRSDLRARARIYFHHPDYTFRHRAAVAVRNQGEDNFFQLHNFIFSSMVNYIDPTDEEILDFIETALGLDMARFARDLVADETYAYLVWDMEQGIAEGVKVSPTVFVCGRRQSNHYLLEEEIDKYL